MLHQWSFAKWIYVTSMVLCIMNICYINGSLQNEYMLHQWFFAKWIYVTSMVLCKMNICYINGPLQNEYMLHQWFLFCFTKILWLKRNMCLNKNTKFNLISLLCPTLYVRLKIICWKKILGVFNVRLERKNILSD